MPFDHHDKLEALLLAAGNQYRPLSELAPGTSSRLIAACQRAMAFLPEERGTLAEFQDELRSYLGRQVARVSPETGTFTAITGDAPPGGGGTEAISLAKRMLRRLRGE
jgi:hypothetical protein